MNNIQIKTIDAKLQGTETFGITDLTPTTPMAVRKLVTAQLNHQAKNDQNVRTRTFFHATPIGSGWMATLVARVIRVVFRTVFLPFSLLVAAYQQSKYAEHMKEDKYNIVLEDLKSVGREWIDFGVTLFAVPVIGTVNTFAPEAIDVTFLKDFYEERVTDSSKKNKTFKAAQEAYIQAKNEKHQEWKNAQVKTEN